MRDPVVGMNRKTWIKTGLIVAGSLAVAAQVFVILVQGRGRADSLSNQTPNGGKTELTGKPLLPLYSHLRIGNLPPVNVLNAIRVPADSKSAASIIQDSSSGTFDRTLDLSATQSPSSLNSFFESELRSKGWLYLGSFRQTSGSTGAGAANLSGSSQILAKRAGSDGNYWEVGVSIIGGAPSSKPVASTSLPIGNKATASSKVTKFQIRIFQVVDEE